MMDETSILTSLARRGAAKEQPKESLDQGVFFRAIADAERRVKEAEAARDAIIAGANREHEEHKREMAALQSRLDSMTAECAQHKARCEAAEGRPPEVRYEQNSADESLRSQNSDLLVRCSSAEARCSEMERTITMLTTQIAQRPVEVERESEPEDEAEEHIPMNYDIDVVRSGDDRIRTLRVRVAQ